MSTCCFHGGRLYIYTQPVANTHACNAGTGTQAHTHTHTDCPLHLFAYAIAFQRHTRNTVLRAKGALQRQMVEGEADGGRWRLSIRSESAQSGIELLSQSQTIAAGSSLARLDGTEHRALHTSFLHSISHSLLFLPPPPAVPFSRILTHSLFSFLFWGLFTSFTFSFCFPLLSFLPLLPPPPPPAAGLISILSVHIIDSSCLPLVKMSFIILCDS